MVSIFRERILTVKNVRKLILIGALLLCAAVAFAACDGDTPSDTDTMDTGVTEETTVEDSAEIPDIDTETEEPSDTAPEETAPESEPTSEEDSGETTAPDDTDSSVICNWLDDYLATLPRLDRQLFVGRYWYNHSVKELAKHYGLTPNATTKRITRVREGLRAYLTERGYVP